MIDTFSAIQRFQIVNCECKNFETKIQGKTSTATSSLCIASAVFLRFYMIFSINTSGLFVTEEVVEVQILKGRFIFMSYYDEYEAEAEDLAECVVKFFKGYGVAIDIKKKKIGIQGNRFIYPVKLKTGTRVNDLRKYTREAKIKLKLPLFEIIEKEQSITIVVSRESQHNNDLSQILESPTYLQKAKSMALAHPIGIDAMGMPVVEDLASYPNMVIAGTTGSGKSVSLKALLTSLISQYSPAQVNILVSDMANDLFEINGIPHLVCPVIQDFDSFFYAMLKLKDELERRLRLKHSKDFRKLPRIVCVIDEFTSYIAINDSRSKLLRDIIMDVLRRSRHARIHMVLAAHNPTKQRLKGLDMSDVPTKMAFRVASLSNSLTVLNSGGAEKLSGVGNMLFTSPRSGGIRWIQGAFISDKELHVAMNKFRRRWAVLPFDSSYSFKIDVPNAETEVENDSIKQLPITKKNADNKLFSRVVMWALNQNTISCNMLTESFGLGWKRANGFIKKLHDIGIVGELDAKLPRKVLPRHLEDISETVINLLQSNGISSEDIENILQKKLSE